jgi:DHA1 family tetracycline resistance protein-like MFS transporter
MDRRLWIIALILFVNVLGSGIILPLLPFFAEELGASPLIIGFFISTLPFFSILAGPPLGALSDRYGRKPVLLISIAGSVAGLLLLGVAQTLPLLFLARIIEGASAGNMATAKAAIADITTQEERVSKLGLTFAAESLGLILGPLIGGVFSQYGLSVSAFIAAAIAALCLVLTLFFFPETRQPAAPQASVGQQPLFNWKSLLQVVRKPQTRDLTFVVFMVQLLIMMMWGNLALYGQNLFGFQGKEIGYISAFAALIGISAQMGLLKVLTRLARDKTIVLTALFAMGTGMALLAASQNTVVLLIGVGLMAASFNIAMPTVVGLVSKRSAESEQGNVMGATASVINFSSLVGPVFANAIFSFSMRGNYWTACALAVAAAIALWIKLD